MSNQHFITSKTRELILTYIKEEGKSYFTLSLQIEVQEQWLRKFAIGEIGRPDINRVLSIYEHLAGFTLEEVIRKAGK